MMSKSSHTLSFILKNGWTYGITLFCHYYQQSTEAQIDQVWCLREIIADN